MSPKFKHLIDYRLEDGHYQYTRKVSHEFYLSPCHVSCLICKTSFSFLTPFCFLASVAVANGQLDLPSLLSIMGNSLVCYSTWSRGCFVSVVEFLWKSGVVLSTEGSHAVLTRNHCATIHFVISPTGCLVSSESVVFMVLTHCHSMTFAAWLTLPQGQNKLICMYEPAHSGSRAKGRAHPD